MLKSLINIYNNVKVYFKEKEIKGSKKVLTLILFSILVILSIGALISFIGAFIILLVPIFLIGGTIYCVKTGISLLIDLIKFKKHEMDVKKEYNEYIKELVEKIDIDKEHIVSDDLGSEVVAQEIPPVDIYDLNAYIRFVKKIDLEKNKDLNNKLEEMFMLEKNIKTFSNEETVASIRRQYIDKLYGIKDMVDQYTNNDEETNSNNNKKRRLYK